MIPVLLKLGPLTIHSFGFMLAVAFLVIAVLLRREFLRRGYTADAAASVVVGAMIGGVLGAKIYFLLDHWSGTLADPLGMIFSGAGLTFYGGLFGGAVGVTVAGLRSGVRFAHLADLAAPMIVLGYAIGRIGCLLTGDDYGGPTDLPWGMTFPRGTPPTTVPVHPTQIYETLAGFAVFGLLWLRRRDWERVPGRILGTYLVLAGIERFLVEYLRTNEPVAAGFTVAQWISVVLGATGLVVLSLARGRVPRTSRARS